MAEQAVTRRYDDNNTETYEFSSGITSGNFAEVTLRHAAYIFFSGDTSGTATVTTTMDVGNGTFYTSVPGTITIGPSAGSGEWLAPVESSALDVNGAMLCPPGTYRIQITASSLDYARILVCRAV